MNLFLKLNLLAFIALNLSACGGKAENNHGATRPAKAKIKKISDSKSDPTWLENELRANLETYRADNGELLHLIGRFARPSLSPIFAASPSKFAQKIPLGQITFTRKLFKFSESYPQNIPLQPMESSALVPTRDTAYLIPNLNEHGDWGIAVEGETALADASSTKEDAAIQYQQSEYCDRYRIDAVNAPERMDQGMASYTLSVSAQDLSCDVHQQCTVHQTSNFHLAGLAIPDRILSLKNAENEFHGQCMSNQTGFLYSDRRSNRSLVKEYKVLIDPNLDRGPGVINPVSLHFKAATEL